MIFIYSLKCWHKNYWEPYLQKYKWQILLSLYVHNIRKMSITSKIDYHYVTVVMFEKLLH